MKQDLSSAIIQATEAGCFGHFSGAKIRERGTVLGEPCGLSSMGREEIKRDMKDARENICRLRDAMAEGRCVGRISIARANRAIRNQEARIAIAEAML